MDKQRKNGAGRRVPAMIVVIGMLTVLAGSVQAAEYKGWDLAGFVEAVNHYRDSDGPDGLTKQRNTAQLEFNKSVNSKFSISGVLRGTYDSAYDINDDDFGSDAGGSVTIENAGGTGALGLPPRVPWGQGIIGADVEGLPGGGGFGFDLATNPNEGLLLLGADLSSGTGGNFLPSWGGVQLAYPARPCDKDSRGCIGSYMNKDEDDLRFPDFNEKLDFIRELYFDYEHAFGSGKAFNLRVGRQQVIWGRTDLFRVLDVVNPVDYSRHNIYDELEDIRIPMGIVNAEYRMGAVGAFDDLNFQGIWNFEPFRPNDLGQGGQPYAILQAGNFFRAMSNCWDNGCTVANFAPTPGGEATVATDFGPNQIGIRNADVPDDWGDTAIGGRIEGVFKGVGFSLNALSYRAQLPTLSGKNVLSDNPFTADVEAVDYPYLIAFDVKFPRLFMVGGSADFYVDPIKSAFRVEVTHTQDEQFANTLEPDLYSESDVLRWVLGWDRPTFIPFLNKTRSFLISAQVFGQHLLDHEKESGLIGPRGIPDWEDNYIATLLINGFYKADRIQPRVIFAYDTGAEAGVVSPQFDWLINDNWRIIAQGNFKWGKDHAFDDDRSANPFPPFTCPPTDPGCDFNSPSLGLGGYEPLGRFQQGPIGMAQKEDEYQLTIRYQF